MKVTVKRRNGVNTKKSRIWDLEVPRLSTTLTNEDMALLLLGGPFIEMDDDTIDEFCSAGIIRIDRVTTKFAFTHNGKEVQTALLEQLAVIDDRIHYRKDLPL